MTFSLRTTEVTEPPAIIVINEKLCELIYKSLDLHLYPPPSAKDIKIKCDLQQEFKTVAQQLEETDYAEFKSDCPEIIWLHSIATFWYAQKDISSQATQLYKERKEADNKANAVIDEVTHATTRMKNYFLCNNTWKEHINLKNQFEVFGKKLSRAEHSIQPSAEIASSLSVELANLDKLEQKIQGDLKKTKEDASTVVDQLNQLKQAETLFENLKTNFETFLDKLYIDEEIIKAVRKKIEEEVERLTVSQGNIEYSIHQNILEIVSTEHDGIKASHDDIRQRIQLAEQLLLQHPRDLETLQQQIQPLYQTIQLRNMQPDIDSVQITKASEEKHATTLSQISKISSQAVTVQDWVVTSQFALAHTKNLANSRVQDLQLKAPSRNRDIHLLLTAAVLALGAGIAGFLTGGMIGFAILIAGFLTGVRMARHAANAYSRIKNLIAGNKGFVLESRVNTQNSVLRAKASPTNEILKRLLFSCESAKSRRTRMQIMKKGILIHSLFCNRKFFTDIGFEITDQINANSEQCSVIKKGSNGEDFSHIKLSVNRRDGILLFDKIPGRRDAIEIRIDNEEEYNRELMLRH